MSFVYNNFEFIMFSVTAQQGYKLVLYLFCLLGMINACRVTDTSRTSASASYNRIGFAFQTVRGNSVYSSYIYILLFGLYKLFILSTYVLPFIKSRLVILFCILRCDYDKRSLSFNF